MNAGERTTPRKKICYCGSVFRKQGGIPNDGDVLADLAHHGERAIEQSLAAKFKESLVFAHAGTLASGEYEAHARRLGPSHMEKHKACGAVHESNLFRIAQPSEDEHV